MIAIKDTITVQSLTTSSRKMRDNTEKTTHPRIHSRYNRFAHLGNVNPIHADTFNKLSKMRYPARYSQEEFSLLESEGQSLLDGIRSMLQETSLVTRANRTTEKESESRKAS